MIDNIADQEWNEWIETGKTTDKRLYSIALRIKQGHELSVRERSIYVYHGQKIEEILTNL
jgi:hypothetical protein